MRISECGFRNYEVVRIASAACRATTISSFVGTTQICILLSAAEMRASPLAC